MSFTVPAWLDCTHFEELKSLKKAKRLQKSDQYSDSLFQLDEIKTNKPTADAVVDAFIFYMQPIINTLKTSLTSKPFEVAE